MKQYITQAKEKIVLEIERPKTREQKRRIKFFEGLGFKLLPYDYLQPSYGRVKRPVSLFIMTFPEKIREAEFLEIREQVHKVVYGLKEPLLGRH